MIQWNPALLEKLRTQLPKDTIPEELFADFSVGSLEDIQAGWVLLQSLVWCRQNGRLTDGFALNLLETSQIQLYRDLDTTEWQTIPKLIQQTLGTGFVVDTQLQHLHAGDIHRHVSRTRRFTTDSGCRSSTLTSHSHRESGGNLRDSRSTRNW